MSVIEKGDIRVGDTIRITREVEVKQVFTYGIQTTNGGVYSIEDADKPVIELLKRPLPPLPTERGAVISVSREGSTENGIWFLTVTPVGTTRWVSASHVEKTPEKMREFLEDFKRTFEVIA